MTHSKGRIVIVQPVLPDYRIKFFQGLHERFGDRLEIYAARNAIDGTVKSVLDSGLPVHWIKPSTIAGGRLVWTHGIGRAVQNADVAVLTLNPRVLDSWLRVGLRRLKRKKVILWGHCWPRNGPRSRTDCIRGFMRRLPSSVIVYTESERAFLQKQLPKKPVYALRNALYLQEEMRPAISDSEPCHVISVGRLVPTKKPQMLIRGFSAALPDLPPETLLHIVGDGPELPACVTLATELGVRDRVVFHGHRSEMDFLRNLYGTATCSVSPGYLGLSLTQSLGFGVPMIVSRNEPHAPEVEAIEEGVNSVYFETDSVKSLAESLVRMFQQRDRWMQLREHISRTCREAYSVENMVECMARAIAD